MDAVICTAKRGVFFGRVDDDTQPGPGALTIRDAQMCIYWSADLHGVLGLASSGPSKTCRIGSPVPELRVVDVTAVIPCTPTAAEAWRATPWR